MNPSIFVSVTTEPGNPQAARETVRYDIFVRRLLKAQPENLEALHIALGLCGEFGELCEAKSKPHEIEEFGDLEFYFQAALNHYNLTCQDLEPYKPRAFSIAVAIGDFADCVKREYIYGKPRQQIAVWQALSSLRNSLDHSLNIFNFDKTSVIQSNAEKLEVRYAGLVYSDLAAVNRADKS